MRYNPQPSFNIHRLSVDDGRSILIRSFLIDYKHRTSDHFPNPKVHSSTIIQHYRFMDSQSSAVFDSQCLLRSQPLESQSFPQSYGTIPQQSFNIHRFTVHGQSMVNRCFLCPLCSSTTGRSILSHESSRYIPQQLNIHRFTVINSHQPMDSQSSAWISRYIPQLSSTINARFAHNHGQSILSMNHHGTFLNNLNIQSDSQSFNCQSSLSILRYNPQLSSTLLMLASLTVYRRFPCSLRSQLWTINSRSEPYGAFHVNSSLYVHSHSTVNACFGHGPVQSFNVQSLQYIPRQSVFDTLMLASLTVFDSQCSLRSQLWTIPWSFNLYEYIVEEFMLDRFNSQRVKLNTSPCQSLHSRSQLVTGPLSINSSSTVLSINISFNQVYDCLLCSLRLQSTTLSCSLRSQLLIPLVFPSPL